MPPLLQRLTERRPETLDYIGVSYGLTPQLLRFWKRAAFVPLYLRQTQSELTGEHTCVMVRGLNSSSEEELQWLGEFSKDFRRRFLSLLSFKFREFGSVTALSVLEAANAGVKKLDEDTSRELSSTELAIHLTPFDLKRLESYANNMLDYHVILDLLPTVAAFYFEKRLGSELRLSAVQSSILLALGLQRKTIEEVESELQLPVNQALALFGKLVRKLSKKLQDVHKAAISTTIPEAPPSARDIAVEDGKDVKGTAWKPVETKLAEELEEAGDEATKKLREKQKAMIDSLDLSKYAIDDASADWSVAEAQVASLGNTSGKSTVVSVKNTAPTGQKRKANDDAPSTKGDKKAGSRRSIKRAKR